MDGGACCGGAHLREGESYQTAREAAEYRPRKLGGHAVEELARGRGGALEEQRHAAGEGA